MRLLLDDHDLPWEQAWAITVKVMSYTNHTIMAEALENGRLIYSKKLFLGITKSLKKSIVVILKSMQRFTKLPFLIGRVLLLMAKSIWRI